MPKAPETFGRRLREVRVSRGLSQVDLAGEELSPSYISRLEAGQRIPTDAVVRLLAKRLDCRAEDLLFGEDANAPADVELELRHAELALRSGEVLDAVARFDRLAALPVQPHLETLRDAIDLGHARALEAVGDHAAALARYLQVAAGDPSTAQVHQATIGACRCYLAYGDLVQAISLGEPVLRWFAQLGATGTDVGVELSAVLAGAYQERGDLATAQRLAAEALAQAEKLADPTVLAAAYRAASLAAHEQGATAEALRLAERGLAALAGGSVDPTGLEVVYGGLLLRTEPPRPDEAIRVLSGARERLTAPGRRQTLAACLTELARAHLLAGEPDRAVEAARAAQTESDSALPDTTRTLLVLAAALEAAGDQAAASEVMSAVESRLAAAEPTRGWARAWREYGDALIARGRTDEAAKAFDQALRLVGLLPHRQVG